MKKFIFALCGLVLLLAACSPALSAPTASPTPLIPTNTATQTPTPTHTPTPTPSPTATLVPLGGSEVAYLYDGQRVPMPEGVKSLLVPSSPDTWKQTGWYFTDGMPYPWGKSIEVGSGDAVIVVPFLVRGVVEIPEPLGNIGGKRIFVVLEVPAHGGSNFVTLNLQDNIYATRPTFGKSYLADGKVPVNWAQSSWGNPTSYEDYASGLKYIGTFDGKQIADELKQHIGQMVMVSFSPPDESVSRSCLQQVVEGTLINQNGQSGIDAINIPVNVILP